MRVDELREAHLNYWTALVDGWTYSTERGMWGKGGEHFVHLPNYVKDWDWCGPLIERFGIFVDGSDPRAEPLGEQVAHLAFGGDLKTAICRAVVASVYGEEVPND